MNFNDCIREKNIIIKYSLTDEIVDVKHYNRIRHLYYEDNLIFTRKIIVGFFLIKNAEIIEDLTSLINLSDNSTVYAIIGNTLSLYHGTIFYNNIEYNKIIEYYDLFYYTISHKHIPRIFIIEHYARIIELYDDDINIMMGLINIIPNKIKETVNGDNKPIYNEYKIILKIIEDLVETGNDIFSIDYNDYSNNTIKLIQAYKLNNVIIYIDNVKNLENKNDEHLIDVAVQYNIGVFYNLSDDYKTEQRAMKAAGFSCHILDLLPKKLMYNKSIIYYALDCNPLSLCRAKQINRKEVHHDYKVVDREKMIEIIKINGINLKHAPDDMKDNDIIARIALNTYPKITEHLSERLRGNKDFMKFAIEKSPWSIIYLAGDIKHDKELTLYAIQINDHNYIPISRTFINDKDVIDAIVKKGWINEINVIDNNFEFM